MKAAVAAINKNDIEALKAALVPLEDVNVGSKTLLYIAAEKGSIPLTKILLDKGGDPNKLGPSGYGPIHIAAKDLEMFKLFIDNNGDLKCPDSHTKTPIFYAVDANAQDVVTLILETTGTGDARCNDKRTPLHDTAERGFCEIATLLLNSGVDVNAQNWNKITPLHLAAMYGRFDMVELLLENGAAIDAQDDKGMTAFHHAAFNGYGDICKFLVSMGCDHMLTNSDGLKAPDIASKELGKELTDFIIASLLQKSRGIQVSDSNYGICVFCQQTDAIYDFHPCHHVSLCQKCYDENKDRLKFCPMCRKTLKCVKRLQDEEPQPVDA